MIAFDKKNTCSMVQESQYTWGQQASQGREAKSEKTTSGSLLQCRGEAAKTEAPDQKPETSVAKGGGGNR